jgi:hypothetical protein
MVPRDLTMRDSDLGMRIFFRLVSLLIAALAIVAYALLVWVVEIDWSEVGLRQGEIFASIGLFVLDAIFWLPPFALLIYFGLRSRSFGELGFGLVYLIIILFLQFLTVMFSIYGPLMVIVSMLAEFAAVLSVIYLHERDRRIAMPVDEGNGAFRLS